MKKIVFPSDCFMIRSKNFTTGMKKYRERRGKKSDQKTHISAIRFFFPKRFVRKKRGKGENFLRKIGKNSLTQGKKPSKYLKKV